MLLKIAVASLLASSAMAACPNSCSGHGTCGTNEVCTCYDGWGMGGAAGGDCSDRFCPYELAWVDAPDKDGKTHQYAECAARGICDRETGECECFGGFEGKACGRQTCPDSCSGHGTCEYMNELKFGTVFNDYYDASTTALENIGVGAVRPASTVDAWDADRARACVCDSGWTGINCASRMCPWGNDIMDTRSNRGVAQVYQVQTITLQSAGKDRNGGRTITGEADTVGDSSNVADAGSFEFQDLSFALRFTSKTNETYTTTPIGMVKSAYQTSSANELTAFAGKIKAALEALPNKVINGVTVTAAENATSTLELIVAVTFDGDSVHGQQNLLEVVADPCGDGCTPKVDGIAKKLVTNTNSLSKVVETGAADFNSFECGRRGKCDFDTGICACFEGYTGEACTSLTALV
jgi:hypothetical protein